MSQAGRHSIRVPLPKALPRAARKKVEAAINAHLSAVQALTAFLDEADGDPDLERDADLEPSLGWGLEGEPSSPDDREADYYLYANGLGQGVSADLEPDIEVDHEPRLAPFELNQAEAVR